MTSKGGQTLDWDADGRMISGLSRSLTYNWDSKLRSATSGSTTVALRYDPDGNRVLRSVNSTTSRKYVVDTVVGLPTILLEIDTAVQDPNDAIVKTYIYTNSQIIAQHDGFYGDALYFYLHDRLGSVREVINTSAAVVSTYTYEPFGTAYPSEVTQTIANPWQFTGQYFDSEFSQYFLRARQYDPAIYRFTARDLYEGSFPYPLELHRYLYCTNDGINQADPSGWNGSLIETQETTGAIATLQTATNTYDYAKRMQHYAKLFCNGVSFQNIIFEVVVDTAFDMVGGKALDFIAGGGGSLINTLKEGNALGIMSYKNLRKKTAKTGLKAHHLMEQRFAKLFGFKGKEGDMLSVALTKDQHQAFTNAWRKKVAYGGNPSQDQVIAAAKEVYADYPEFLAVLGLL